MITNGEQIQNMDIKFIIPISGSHTSNCLYVKLWHRPIPFELNTKIENNTSICQQKVCSKSLAK